MLLFALYAPTCRTNRRSKRAASNQARNLTRILNGNDWQLGQVWREEAYRIGNRMRVVVFVRRNTIISESNCRLDTKRDDKQMKHTANLIRHGPPSKHFDR